MTKKTYRGLRPRLRTLLILCALCLLGGPARAQKTRPAPEGTPTRVETVVMVLDFRDVNSAQQSFTANVFVLLRWQDSRLEHAGPTSVRRALTEIWSPRPQVANQEKLWKTFPEEVEIDPDGLVTYRQRYYGSFSQPLDLAEFPLDRQTFQIELVIPGYGPDEVQLVDSEEVPSGLSTDLSLPDWRITDWSARSTAYSPQPGVEGISGFVLSIEAERYIGYYLFQVLMPLLLVLAMSWTVFWVDPQELGTRISVSVTSMLTLIAFRFMTGHLLPKVSYLTRLDIIVLGATLLVFASICEAVVTSGMAKHGKLEQARAIDRKARFVWPLVFAIGCAAALTG